MSVNLVNQDLSLNKLASNSNVTLGIREAVMGQTDVLFNGSLSSYGTVTLSHPYTNYDYIEIQVSNSKFYAFESKRYLKNMIDNSSSSNKLRYYMTSSSNFTFYKTSSTQLYFSVSSLVLSKIVGYKLGVMKATIDNPKNGDVYTTSMTATGGTWIDGKPIYRTVREYRLTSAIQSSTTSNTLKVAFNTFNCKDVVDFKCYAVTTGPTYPIPYINSSGNYISAYLSLLSNEFIIISKGITWDARTTFRFIVDYTI